MPSQASTPFGILAADAEATGPEYTVVGTFADQFDRAKAKANVEDAITRYPDIAGMVGLFEYNPPLILEALGDKAGKQIKVIAFDEPARRRFRILGSSMLNLISGYLIGGRRDRTERIVGVGIGALAGGAIDLGGEDGVLSLMEQSVREATLPEGKWAARPGGAGALPALGCERAARPR